MLAFDLPLSSHRFLFALFTCLTFRILAEKVVVIARSLGVHLPTSAYPRCAAKTPFSQPRTPCVAIRFLPPAVPCVFSLLRLPSAASALHFGNDCHTKQHCSAKASGFSPSARALHNRSEHAAARVRLSATSSERAVAAAALAAISALLASRPFSAAVAVMQLPYCLLPRLCRIPAASSHARSCAAPLPPFFTTVGIDDGHNSACFRIPHFTQRHAHICRR